MHECKRATVLLMMSMILASAYPVSALENTGKGKILAQRWCASCHLVSPDQDTGSADVPPFMSLAKRPERELDKLSAFLTDPHPVMPNMQLTRNEIADIVAYIRSLK